ncbi:MAG: KH domain-containing protein [SAR202 cluster bacterium]|nr:RNA-binding protein [Chloroflexota bacterium]MQG38458.1 KH domain-containing protein [SAR202 cluster bacterium]
MKDLVEYIAKSIASKPEEVTVTEETNDEEVTLIKLEVAPEDKGKVIGRQGRVAQSIRLLLRVSAVKNGTKAILEIV